VVAVLHSQPKL